MIINRPNATVQFGEYEPGEVFVSDGNYFMVIQSICTEFQEFNAVNLETGELVYFDSTDFVCICHMELCPA